MNSWHLHIIICLIEKQGNVVENKAIEPGDVNVALYLHIDNM